MTPAAMAALVEAINAPTRPPALQTLACPKYPERELKPQVRPDGSISFTLSKWGWEYKHRGPRPLKTPPPADTAAIHTALNAALAPGYSVQTVEDCGTFIKITLGGNQRV